MSATAATVFQGGFSDAPRQAAYAFRAVMIAMARPGTRKTVTGVAPPAPLSVASGSILLTLCDPDTGLYLAGEADCQPLRDWVSFHTGAPIVGPDVANFVLGTWADLQPLDRFAIGTPEYPDRSATLIVEMPDWPTPNARLTGPGIADHAEAWLPNVSALQANAALYPLGLDFIFACGDTLAALPRSTRITKLEG
ncbi:MAG: phosphonate C-P lyase system protein PhnH [Pseudomonadota bacterium]